MTITTYLKAKEEGTVLNGIAKMMEFNTELKSDVLVVDMENQKVHILREEADIESEKRSMLDFIGSRLYFKITEVNEETGEVYGSRKAVQEIAREAFVERLKEGEVVEGVIVSFTNFGAYVEVQGASGLLKNVYFSEDYTAVKDVHKVGDKVNIRLLKVTEKGRLLFEADEKFSNPTVVDLSVLKPGQFLLGTVRNLTPFGVFVNVAPGVDALCSIPPTMELGEGMQVAVRLTQIQEGTPAKVRAKIQRLIENEEQ